MHATAQSVGGAVAPFRGNGFSRCCLFSQRPVLPLFLSPPRTLRAHLLSLFKNQRSCLLMTPSLYAQSSQIREQHESHGTSLLIITFTAINFRCALMA